MNPYATSFVDTEALPVQIPHPDELAGRLVRLGAAMIDGILISVFILPVALITGYFQRAATQSIGVVDEAMMALVSVAGVLIMNGYLLASRGQTIGKLVTKIQIVDFKTSSLIPFARLYIFRYLWMLPFAIVTWFIPGTVDAQILGILNTISILLIFGGQRRCLHDYLAGSKVVLYLPDRPRL